jgi:hypothetical protein
VGEETGVKVPSHGSRLMGERGIKQTSEGFVSPYRDSPENDAGPLTG